MIKVLHNHRYNVQKIGEEGPLHTTTAADFMKPLIDNFSEESSREDDDDFEENIRVEC